MPYCWTSQTSCCGVSGCTRKYFVTPDNSVGAAVTRRPKGIALALPNTDDLITLAVALIRLNHKL